jgi:predicted MFS family arabinose efflux permease
MGLFAFSAVLIMLIPEFHFITTDKRGAVTLNAIRRDFAAAWLRLSRDPTAFLGLVLLVATSTSTLIIATLLPKFSTQVLGIAPENIVFVLAPAAVGVFLGLRSVEFFSDRFNKLVTISVAYVLMAGSLIALGLVAASGDLIRSLDPTGIFHDSLLGERGARILATVLFANLFCFALTTVMTIGRVLINERVPMQMQGRVFAAQAVLANLAAILPVLLAGLLADAVGVAPVLICAGIGALLAAGWSHARSSRISPSLRVAGAVDVSE